MVSSVQIDRHVYSPASDPPSDVPLLLLGAMGMGKSSVMCQAADQAVNKVVHGNIPRYSFIHTLFLKCFTLLIKKKIVFNVMYILKYILACTIQHLWLQDIILLLLLHCIDSYI